MNSENALKSKGMFGVKRKNVAFAIGLGIGVWSITLYTRFGLAACVAVGVLAAALSIFALLRSHKCLFLGALAAIIGLSLALIAIPAPIPNACYQLVGDIYDIRGPKVTLSHCVITTDSQESRKVSGRVNVYYYGDLNDFSVGNTIVLTADMTFVCPDKDDSALYALSKRVTADARVMSEVIVTSDNRTLKTVFYEIRCYVSDTVDALFRDNAALVKGLLLGDTSELAPDEISAARIAGVAHLFAVSGLHIGILVMLLDKIFSLFTGNPVPITVALFVVLPFYSALTWFTPSVTRASIMALLTFVSKSRLRRSDRLTVIANAFIAMLLFNPMQLFSVSFQLSFSIVLGLDLLGKPMSQLITRFNVRLSKKILLNPFDSVTATLSVIPCAMMNFSSLSVYAPIVNLFMIPYASAVVGLVMITVGIGLVYLPTAKALAAVADPLTGFIITLSEAVAAMPCSSLPVPKISAATCIMCFIAMTAASRHIVAPADRLGNILISKRAMLIIAICITLIFVTTDSLIAFIV